LKAALEQAVRDCAANDPDCQAYLAKIGKVEVWPMMPPGDWGLVSFLTESSPKP
jgi:hypothetical protein